MLEKVLVNLFKDDLEYLRNISKVRGELTVHIRKAVNQYVNKLKEGK